MLLSRIYLHDLSQNADEFGLDDDLWLEAQDLDDLLQLHEEAARAAATAAEPAPCVEAKGQSSHQRQESSEVPAESQQIPRLVGEVNVDAELHVGTERKDDASRCTAGDRESAGIPPTAATCLPASAPHPSAAATQGGPAPPPSPRLLRRRERKRLQAQRYRATHAEEVERGERRVAELRRQLAELEQENLDLQLRSTVLANCLQRFQSMFHKLASLQEAMEQPPQLPAGDMSQLAPMTAPCPPLVTSTITPQQPVHSLHDPLPPPNPICLPPELDSLPDIIDDAIAQQQVQNDSALQSVHSTSSFASTSRAYMQLSHRQGCPITSGGMINLQPAPFPSASARQQDHQDANTYPQSACIPASTIPGTSAFVSAAEVAHAALRDSYGVAERGIGSGVTSPELHGSGLGAGNMEHHVYVSAQGVGTGHLMPDAAARLGITDMRPQMHGGAAGHQQWSQSHEQHTSCRHNSHHTHYTGPIAGDCAGEVGYSNPIPAALGTSHQPAAQVAGAARYEGILFNNGAVSGHSSQHAQHAAMFNHGFIPGQFGGEMQYVSQADMLSHGVTCDVQHHEHTTGDLQQAGLLCTYHASRGLNVHDPQHAGIRHTALPHNPAPASDHATTTIQYVEQVLQESDSIASHGSCTQHSGSAATSTVYSADPVGMFLNHHRRSSGGSHSVFSAAGTTIVSGRRVSVNDSSCTHIDLPMGSQPSVVAGAAAPAGPTAGRDAGIIAGAFVPVSVGHEPGFVAKHVSAAAGTDAAVSRSSTGHLSRQPAHSTSTAAGTGVHMNSTVHQSGCASGRSGMAPSTGVHVSNSVGHQTGCISGSAGMAPSTGVYINNGVGHQTGRVGGSTSMAGSEGTAMPGTEPYNTPCQPQCTPQFLGGNCYFELADGYAQHGTQQHQPQLVGGNSSVSMDVSSHATHEAQHHPHGLGGNSSQRGGMTSRAPNEAEYQTHGMGVNSCQPGVMSETVPNNAQHPPHLKPLHVPGNSSTAVGMGTSPKTPSILPKPDPSDPEVAARLERYKHLSLSSVAAEWSAYVEQAAVVLSKYESEDPSANDDDVEYVVQLSGMFCFDFAVANLRLLSLCWCMNLETLEGEVPTLEFWRNVVEKMGLTQEQTKHAVLVYGWISAQYEGIAQQAALICKHLDLPGSDKARTASKPPTAPEASHNSTQQEQQPSSEELQEQLRMLTNKYKTCINISKVAMFAHIGSKVQWLKAMVHSYPFMPDSTALLIAAAEKGWMQERMNSLQQQAAKLV